MTFWILLAVMSLVAVGFAIWPLYTHQRRLTPLLGATVVFVVLLSAGLYNNQGRPDLLAVGGPTAETATTDLGDLDSAIAGLAARLAENPDDVQGWKMLARSYLQVQNYDGAAEAFERVLSLEPGDPESLFYGGLAAGERGNTELAASRWERLLATNPPADIQETIAQWRGEALPAEHPPIESTEPPAEQPAAVVDSPVSAGAVVRASLSLSDAAAAAITGDAMVFIIARDVNVPVPPIAVTRRRVSELPAAVELGDRESMVEGRNLSSFAEFELVARISLSGRPSAQPGDWYGSVIVTPAESNTVELLIDQEVQ